MRRIRRALAAFTTSALPACSPPGSGGGRAVASTGAAVTTLTREQTTPRRRTDRYAGGLSAIHPPTGWDLAGPEGNRPVTLAPECVF